MKLIEKLTSIKDTIVESYEEYSTIKDMTASEIAQRYGYTNLLSYVRKELWEKVNEPIIIVDEEVDENENSTDDAVLLKFSRVKNEDNKIIIHAEGFGEKQSFDLAIVKLMLKKYNADVSIGQIEGEDYLCIKMVPPKPSMEKQLEEFNQAKDEYISYVKGKAGEAKKAAGSFAKKKLNDLADWANKNL